MKKFLISLVMLLNLSVAGLFAQNSLVATLSHGDNISMYYGNNALKDALNAAVNGDVISLSGGNFTCSNITKAVTIRGIGIDDSLPTVVTSQFDINIVENEPGKLSLEGISFIGKIITRGSKGSSAYFTKCRFEELVFERSPIKANITNCKILIFSNYESKSIQFLNSRIYKHGLNDGTSLVNCVIKVAYGNNPTGVQAINTVFFADNYDHYGSTNANFQLSSSNTVINCVAVNLPKLFAGLPVNIENKTSSIEDFFKNYDDGKFELTDEAKTKFLGTDSTEVGWYGGVLPYTSIPSYPRITKMNVANKSTADGKLSVEIEVSAAK